MMMGDVSSGSATVSMVRQVLKWQKDHPEHAARMMDAIHSHTMDVERGFAEICDLETSITASDWKEMAAVSRDQVSTVSFFQPGLWLSHDQIDRCYLVYSGV